MKLPEHVALKVSIQRQDGEKFVATVQGVASRPDREPPKGTWGSPDVAYALAATNGLHALADQIWDTYMPSALAREPLPDRIIIEIRRDRSKENGR